MILFVRANVDHDSSGSAPLINETYWHLNFPCKPLILQSKQVLLPQSKGLTAGKSMVACRNFQFLVTAVPANPCRFRSGMRPRPFSSGASLSNIPHRARNFWTGLKGAGNWKTTHPPEFTAPRKQKFEVCCRRSHFFSGNWLGVMGLNLKNREQLPNHNPRFFSTFAGEC